MPHQNALAGGVDESVYWLFGVVLSLSATLVGSLGRILLRLAHLVDAKVLTTSRGYSGMCIFYFGAVCLIINPSIDVVSYFFASPTLLAPLAGLTLIWNIILAPVILSERLSFYTIGGSMSALIGCILVGAYGPRHDREFENMDEIMTLFSDPSFMLYMSCCSTLILFLLSIIYWELFSDFWIKLAYGITTGSLGGFFIFLKCAIELVQMNVFDRFFTWFIIFIASALPLCGLVLLNNSLKTYDSLFVLPIFHASLVLTGSTSSIVLFQDLQELSAHRIHCYIVAIGLICFGVLLVSFHTDEKEDEEEESLLQDELSISLDDETVKKILIFDQDHSINDFQVTRMTNLTQKTKKTKLTPYTQYGSVDPAGNSGTLIVG